MFTLAFQGSDDSVVKKRKKKEKAIQTFALCWCHDTEHKLGNSICLLVFNMFLQWK